MKTLQEIKNNYAQEQGYEDWNELRKELYGDIPELKIESYMNEICIRAQKEVLEYAAQPFKILIPENVEVIQTLETEKSELLEALEEMYSKYENDGHLLNVSPSKIESLIQKHK